MDNHITFEKTIEMLKLQDMDFHILELGGDWRAVITQYGGRLLGPFQSDGSESVLWMNSAWKYKTGFRRFVCKRDWNLGGERLWINPELRFFCKAPELFSDTYTVQTQLDPGSYAVETGEGDVKLRQDIELMDLNDGSARKLSILRRYMPARNPLKYIYSLQGAKLDYCGYVHAIELQGSLPDAQVCMEPWTVTQVNPGGRFIVPCFGKADFVDYYGNNAQEMQKICEGYAELDANGARKYKLGYRAAQTFGRMAYLKPWGDGWHLMLRNYYNDPSIPYCAEPFGNLGNRGCSMYFYNDRGGRGGFAEFENAGTPLGFDTGENRSVSTSSTWFFFGGQQEIAGVIRELLGIEYKF